MTDVGGRGGGGGGGELKAHSQGHCVFTGGAEGISAVEDPARTDKPPPGALEHGAADPDGAGLEFGLVETEDERAGPAMLDEATRGPGGDSAAAGGGRAVKCDPEFILL